MPAVYAICAGLQYIRKIGVNEIDAHTRPLVLSCLEGLKKLPVECLTPDEPASIAGIIAFQHPEAERIHHRLHEQNIHIMSAQGRLRVSVHGYNTMEDIDRFLSALDTELKKF